jgi:hypothetical protein
MSLRCVRIDFANAISSKTVFITQEVFDELIRKYEARERRHSFVYKLSHEDREERRCHLDLDGVVLIEPCGGAPAS